MQSLTALIRGTRADDPLARALEAVLDSGLVIFSRDTEGHFVQLSEVLSERVGIIADSGTSQPRNLRVFDENGRLLPGSEYPAAITRRTGTPQREVLRKLVSDDDREIWLQMSTLPLERGRDGWSVLTVGSDVTEFVTRANAAERESAARGALLELSDQLATSPLSGPELYEAFRAPLAALLPDTNVSFAQRAGNEYVTTPLVDGYGEPVAPRRGRYSTDQRSRWTAKHAHVNQDVQDTDIYGANVVAEFSHPIRSIAIAPCFGSDAERIGALVAYAAEPGAFTDGQIRTLEITASMFGRAVEAAASLAQAS